MTDELNTLWMAMQFKFSTGLGIIAWTQALRIVFVCFNTKLKEFMEQALPAERVGIQRFMDSLPYRVLAFLINMLASVKLPTVARKGDGDTTHISGDPTAPDPRQRANWPKE